MGQKLFIPLLAGGIAVLALAGGVVYMQVAGNLDGGEETEVTTSGNGNSLAATTTSGGGGGAQTSTLPDGGGGGSRLTAAEILALGPGAPSFCSPGYEEKCPPCQAGSPNCSCSCSRVQAPTPACSGGRTNLEFRLNGIHGPATFVCGGAPVSSCIELGPSYYYCPASPPGGFNCASEKQTIVLRADGSARYLCDETPAGCLRRRIGPPAVYECK
ncbi:MAG: hypothetical protein HY436_00805 [Candidatus Liptonbacteria bacterium]|nr:hypothetical protein [Candidatus Liptonbacteria bacterium]